MDKPGGLVLFFLLQSLEGSKHVWIFAYDARLTR